MGGKYLCVRKMAKNYVCVSLFRKFNSVVKERGGRAALCGGRGEEIGGPFDQKLDS